MVVSETSVEGSPIGNIKKFEVVTKVDNTTGTVAGQVVDSTNTPALDSKNVIKDSAKSDWSSQADGREIDKGGVGEVLLDREKPRTVFTFLGDTNLNAESNAFDTSNKKITANLLGVEPVEREKLIQYLLGYDSYDRSNDKGTQ